MSKMHITLQNCLLSYPTFDGTKSMYMNRILHYLTGVLMFVSGHLCLGQHLFETTYLQDLPEPISNNAVCGRTINNTTYLYSFGGIDTSKIYSGIHLKSYKYDSSTDTWTQLPSLPDNIGKIAAGASIVGDVAYIFGGYHVFSNHNEKSSEKVHRFDLLADTFLIDGADIPVPTDDHVQVTWKDSLIYLITGWSQTTNIPNVQIYDPKNDSWQVGAQTPNTHDYKSFGASGAIVGNTIYYFGGARYASNFPIQNQLRIGKINPSDPAQIDWSIVTPDSDIVGYRMACFAFQNRIFWIGGSETTYNYDGIAYAGSIPVEPANRILELDTNTLQFIESSFVNNNSIPMDLRGTHNLGADVFLVGGMNEGQKVSDKTLWIKNKTTHTPEIEHNYSVSVYPNPIRANKTLRILTPNNALTKATLYTVSGQKLKSSTANQLSIDSSFPCGMYFLTIELKNGKTIVKKVQITE